MIPQSLLFIVLLANTIVDMYYLLHNKAPIHVFFLLLLVNTSLATFLLLDLVLP